MNRTQKNAWFGLVNCLVAAIFCCFFFYRALFYIPASGFRFVSPLSQIEIIVKAILHFWPLVLPFIALILLLILRKKQSPAEPDFDELDIAIQNKATHVAFISIWLLWPLTLLSIMSIISTFNPVTPFPAIAFFCFFISTTVFAVCMAIYFLIKILLYRKHTEGGAE